MIGAAGPGSEARVQGSGSTAFGKYQLFASLGRGGMADVFLSVARGQMGFNKLAVIKRLKPALAQDPAFLTMFLDEARLAARLNHPNIVHTYEVGEQNGVYFIAMEYLEGQSLNKVLKEANRRKIAIDPSVAVRIVADALAGLGYAHELRDYDGSPLRIIHRDISPHNLFVTYDGFTKVVDFGIAKAAVSSTETEVGVLKGKVAYMAPEQALGLSIDGRSDLFAMGIVLWELLSQQRLMTGESAANTLHKLMNEPIPRLSQVMPQIDPELDRITARALEKDPDARFRSASEMREALEAWLAERTNPARTEDVSEQMLGLFGAFREETQRQIQKYMAATSSADTTQELKALSAASLSRVDAGGVKPSEQLLRLGAHAGESGIVSNYPGLATSTSAYPASSSGAQPPVPRPDRSSKNPLYVVLAVGTFLLLALGILVFGLRDRSPVVVAQAPPASSSPAAAPPPSPPAAAPSPSPSVTEPPVVADEVPVVAASALASAAPTSTAKPAHGAVKPKGGAAPRPTEPKPTPPPSPTAAEPGFVTMSAYPWAKVTEGSRVVCPVTPCSKVQMSPGTHVLTFENGESPGQKQSVSVHVKSGETSTKIVGFK